MATDLPLVLRMNRRRVECLAGTLSENLLSPGGRMGGLVTRYTVIPIDRGREGVTNVRLGATSGHSGRRRYGTEQCDGPRRKE